MPFTRLGEVKCLDSQTYGETFRIFPRNFSPGDTIAVSLSPTTEDYFDFIQMRLDNRFSFVGYLGSPINYSSNVKGGKGFFNLYIPDVRLFIPE